MSEFQLAEDLRRAADTLIPPTERLVGGGVELGRSRTRHRRMGQGLAVASVVGVVGAATFVVPTLLGSTHAADPQAFSTSQAPLAVATQPHHPKASRAAQANTPPPAQLAQSLASLLPAGATTDLLNRAGDGFQAGSLLYDDGNGVAEIDVLVESSKAGTGPGHLQTFENSPEYPGDNPGGVISNIVNWYQDGFHVSVTAYNGAAEKGQSHTRATPPLTVDQLAAIAQNPVWLP